jgi:hypothetical protein
MIGFVDQCSLIITQDEGHASCSFALEARLRIAPPLLLLFAAKRRRKQNRAPSLNELMSSMLF